MARLTEEQAEIISRRIEIQLSQGNWEIIDRILLEAHEEAEQSQKGIVAEYPVFDEIPIARLGASVRSTNLLEDAGYMFVRDLKNASRASLLAIPNMGPTEVEKFQNRLMAMAWVYEKAELDKKTSEAT